jgi:serine/threonine protein kinase
MLVGTLIEGRYLVNALLGAGGGGSVFAARDNQMHRDVAIKLLSEKSLWDADAIKRFQREAKLMARIKHPNVVQIYAFGIWHDKVPYLVCELLDGQSLRSLLMARGKLDWTEALPMVADICAGLNAMHQQGIVHRDLKPDNLIVTTSGAVKIIDLGLSKPVDPAQTKMTATGLVMGTPSYMSPEQSRGQKATTASDIYTVGCIMFEMLCGEAPFHADDPLGVMYKHLHDEMPSLRSKHVDVPEYVEVIIRKACAKSPDDRYQSAEAMSTDLREASVNPIKYKRSLPPISRSTSRRLALAALVITTAGILSVLPDPGTAGWALAQLKNAGALTQAADFLSSVNHPKAAVDCLLAASKYIDEKDIPAVAENHLKLAKLYLTLENPKAAIEQADKSLYTLAKLYLTYVPPSMERRVKQLTEQTAQFFAQAPDLNFDTYRGLNVELLQGRFNDDASLWMQLQKVILASKLEHSEYEYHFSEYALKAYVYAAFHNNLAACKPLIEQAIVESTRYTDTDEELKMFRLLKSQVEKAESHPSPSNGSLALQTLLTYLSTAPMDDLGRCKLIFQFNKVYTDYIESGQGRSEYHSFVTALKKLVWEYPDKASAVGWCEAIDAYNYGKYTECVHYGLHALSSLRLGMNDNRAAFVLTLINFAAMNHADAAMKPDLLKLRKMIDTQVNEEHFRERKLGTLNYTLFIMSGATGNYPDAGRFAEDTMRCSDYYAPFEYYRTHLLICQLIDKGDLNGARIMLDGAQSIADKHQSYLDIPLNLSRSRLLALEGNREQALDFARRALAESEKVAGPAHPTTKMIAAWVDKLKQPGVSQEELRKVDLRGNWPIFR